MSGWHEVGDQVYVRRHVSLDLNCGLIVGEDACLVVDTRSHDAEARDLIEAIRHVTPHPWIVVDTHAHFDHAFGNASFRPAMIWGHRQCATRLRERGALDRARIVAEARADPHWHEFAHAVEAVEISPPDAVVDDFAELEVGGRSVVITHHGLGHTDGDVVVAVPAAGVLFAGDLVEEGAPPGFGDAYPLSWPRTLDGMLAQVGGPVVPGHGAVVDAAFVRAQRDEIAALAELARSVVTAGRPLDDAVRDAPFPPDVARTALERAILELNGHRKIE
jgi:glyoxylase-like metal-dependent hydrolase (beta-lactamase superfamily II)